MDEELLQDGAEALGIGLNAVQIAQFNEYSRLLIEWNERMNLTSISDPRDIVVKHHLDSLTSLTRCEFPQGAVVADVGSGAGFPGLPLAIVRPDIRIVLIEATRKKLDFLAAVYERISKTGDITPSVELVNARAEEIGRDPKHREQYDVVTARAVADMRVLVEYCLPLAKVGGVFIAYKGPDVDAEVNSARPAIGVLGGDKPEITHLTLPTSDHCRSLVRIEKIKPTPGHLPRHGSRISKKPL